MAGGRLRTVLPPIVAGITMVVLWEVWVNVGGVKGTIIPAPSAVWSKLTDNTELLRLCATATFLNAVRGLALGTFAAIVLALVTTRFRPLERGLTPLAVVLAATPIVVLSPIANIWFGLTTATSKVVVIAVVTFFPVYLNTLRGLDGARSNDLELMRSYGASAWTTLTKVKIPTSVPFLFTGLKVAASLAMITAIVTEYFGGNRRSLGVLITQQASLSKFDMAWAGIAVACALSLGLYGAVLLIERLVAPWRTSAAQ